MKVYVSENGKVTEKENFFLKFFSYFLRCFSEQILVIVVLKSPAYTTQGGTGWIGSHTLCMRYWATFLPMFSNFLDFLLLV